MQLRLLARSFADAFESVSDAPGRRRYPLRSILALAALAALDGAFTAGAIIRWVSGVPDLVTIDLGFANGQIPALDTLRQVIRQVDRTAVGEALERWAFDQDHGPERERVGGLRIATRAKSSGSVLFEFDGSALDAGQPPCSATVNARGGGGTVPPLRRWKRTHVVI